MAVVEAISEGQLQTQTGIYKAKEEDGPFFNDGREEHLLEYVRQALESSHSFKNPKEVLRLIDDYGQQHKYLMNVGSKKGQIVTDLITQRKPAYAVRRGGGKKYISFERDAKFAGVAGALVELAGLDDIVTFVVGSSSKNLLAEHAAGRLQVVDMMFLDHYKPAYVRDLKICESLGLIRAGTVLAADNVITPGNPSYLEYVRSSPREKERKATEGSGSETAADQRFQQRTINQYDNVEEDDAVAPGNPGMVYESYLVQSEEPTGDPDGIEVTTCVGV